MTEKFHALTQDITSNLGELGKTIPQVMKAFGELNKAGSASGALDAKTKELIALAIGVAVRCDGCIGFHTKALAKLGATEAEVHEALGVAVYMGGGPAMMYAANATAAYKEFSNTEASSR